MSEHFDGTLADVIDAHRDRLERFMADARRCDDVASGAPQGYSQQYHYNSYGHGHDDHGDAAPSTNSPVIYSDSSFSGSSMELKAGTYDLNDLGRHNDAISSVKVPSGWKVTLYTDAGLTGRSKTFTSDAAYVGDDFNDVASSIKVERT